MQESKPKVMITHVIHMIPDSSHCSLATQPVNLLHQRKCIQIHNFWKGGEGGGHCLKEYTARHICFKLALTRT